MYSSHSRDSPIPSVQPSGCSSSTTSASWVGGWGEPDLASLVGEEVMEAEGQGKGEEEEEVGERVRGTISKPVSSPTAF